MDKDKYEMMQWMEAGEMVYWLQPSELREHTQQAPVSLPCGLQHSLEK